MNIICLLLGHKYQVVQRFNKTNRRVRCTRCNKDWGMNDSTQSLVKWDSELEEMYQRQGHTIKQPSFKLGFK